MEIQIRVMDIKRVPIGNSRGVRKSEAFLEKYGSNNSLLLEETDRGLLLRKKNDNKLSWEGTYKFIANEKEDWDDFYTTLLDGLNEFPHLRGANSGAGNDPGHEQDHNQPDTHDSGAQPSKPESYFGNS